MKPLVSHSVPGEPTGKASGVTVLGFDAAEWLGTQPARFQACQALSSSWDSCSLLSPDCLELLGFYCFENNAQAPGRGTLVNAGVRACLRFKAPMGHSYS